MPLPRIQLEQSVLLLIDMQEKFAGHIADWDHVVERCSVLVRGCVALGVPILATEQYPKGLGPTIAELRQHLPADQAIESKLKFSAFVEPIRRRLDELAKRTVILCGIETHVCVLQTALDLARAGYQTVLAGDATGSRRNEDKALAFNRMRDFGVVVSSAESALMEMVHEAGTERFGLISPIIR